MPAPGKQGGQDFYGDTLDVQTANVAKDLSVGGTTTHLGPIVAPSITVVGPNSPNTPSALALAGGAAGAGVINDTVYFPPASGGDDTAVLQAIINLALGREYQFMPNQSYSISAGLNPSANGQRFYIPASTTITQATWGSPHFEVRNLADVEIDCPGLLTTTQPQTQFFGAYLTDIYGVGGRCAGVYSYQSDRLKIPRMRVNNQIVAVCLSGDSVGLVRSKNVQIGTLYFSNVNWGLLYGLQEGLRVGHLDGTTKFINDFPHAIYSSSAASTPNLDCHIASARSTGTGGVSTSSAGAVNIATPATITPASLTNIAVGLTLQLDLDSQHGTFEAITVLSVNTGAGTFTANVVGNHTAGVLITTDHSGFQFKTSVGLQCGRLISDGTGSIISIDSTTDAMFSELIGYNMTGVGNIESIFFIGAVGTVQRVRFGLVELHLAAPPGLIQGNAIKLQANCTDVTFDDVFISVSPTADSQTLITVRGTRTKFNHLKVVSQTAHYPRAIVFDTGTGHTLADLETVGCQYGWYVQGATGCFITYVDALQGTSAGFQKAGIITSGSATVLRQDPFATNTFLTGAAVVVPVGASRARILLVGGGGGGGGGGSAAVAQLQAGGGGGSGGGYLETTIPVVVGNTLTVVVGTAGTSGAGGAAGGNLGGAGGAGGLTTITDTTAATLLASTVAGNGGAGPTASSTTTVNGGYIGHGPGSVAVGNTVLSPGGGGQSASSSGLPYFRTIGGGGGGPATATNGGGGGGIGNGLTGAQGAAGVSGASGTSAGVVGVSGLVNTGSGGGGGGGGAAGTGAGGNGGIGGTGYAEIQFIP